MAGRPKKLFWVDMRLSDGPKNYNKHRHGVRGGKRSSLSACRDAKRTILNYDPAARVRIYEADANWKEVD